MFGNDYKTQMDKIKPDGYIKQKVRRKLSQNEKEPQTKSVKIYFGKAVAAALSLALFFTIGAIMGRNSAPNTIVVENKTPLETANDYDKIYSALKEFKQSFWDELKDSIGYNGLFKNHMAEIADDVNTETALGTSQSNHSQTTTQVNGVDEADVIKTDGKYFYILSHRDGGNRIKIVESGANPKQLSDIVIDQNVYSANLYLNGDRLVVLSNKSEKQEVKAIIYDISNPEKPELVQICTQSGHLNTSRLIGNKLYVVSYYNVSVNDMIKSDTESYIPYIYSKEYKGAVASDTVYLYEECRSPEFTVISAFNIKDGTLISTQSILGGTNTVYANTDNIVVAGMSNGNETQIARFKIQDGNIELKASANLKGSLLNQFSIDEYNGYFRFVLTETKILKEGAVIEKGATIAKYPDKTITVNSLVVLDGELKECGKITDIAPDERVYSVRFMGDTAYFVTFRQVDPLFSVDLKDPNNPKIIGALKIPGFSNYLFPYGEGKLLGIGQNADETTGRTNGMKLSMFDISDPANVTENDKTNIPAYHSESLYNHKAILCDYGKNIIAFSAYGNYSPNTFFVYSYENGEFVKKLQTETNGIEICRGAYIGNIFYIVTDYSINYYNIKTFEKIGTLDLI